MTKQITTESGIVLLLDMPVGANRLKIFNDERPYISYFVNTDTFREYLPEGKWQGKHFKEMEEGDYYMIVGRSFKNYQPKQQLNQQSQYDMFWVKCPNGKEEHFESKKDSFSYAVKMELVYILHSNGFDPENTVVLTLK